MVLDGRCAANKFHNSPLRYGPSIRWRKSYPGPRVLGPWHTYPHTCTQTYINTHIGLFNLKPSVHVALGGIPHAIANDIVWACMSQGTDNMDAQITVALLHFGITLICFAHVPLVFCACTVSLVGNMLSLKTHQRNTQQIMCYARFSNEFQKSRVWLVHMFASNAFRTCSAKVVGAGRLSSR
jgi:hypothetical protein